MIQLKEFQEKAKNELVMSISNGINFLENQIGDNLSYGFQSPTGSGKTIIMQEVIRELLKIDNIFITWIAPGKLAEQSLKKFQQNNLDILDFSKLSVSDREDIFSNDIKIGLINNEKVNNNNNLINRDNEDRLSLPNIYSELKEKNKIIIFIVDESHIGAEKINTNISNYINRYSDIKLFVSATLHNKVNLTKLISVKRKDVVKAEMIKKRVKFNCDFIGHDLSNTEVTDNYLLKLSINKLKELEELHNEINPLLIIQVPNGYYAKTDTADIFINEIIEKSNNYIKKEDIKTFLSENNDLDENTCKNNSTTKVIITKVAAATGWDCPRAQVLLTYRYSSSKTLIKQLVGRILRMPEMKHYDNELLNYGYVYTNSEGIQDSFYSNKDDNGYDNSTNAVNYPIKKEFKDFHIPYLINHSVDKESVNNFKKINKYFDNQFNNLVLEEKELESIICTGFIEDYDENKIFSHVKKSKSLASSSEAEKHFMTRLRKEFSFLGNGNLSQIGNRIIKKFKYKKTSIIAANYELIALNLRELIINHTNFLEREDLLIEENFSVNSFNLPSEIEGYDSKTSIYKKYMYEQSLSFDKLNEFEKELAEHLELNADIKAWVKNGDNGSKQFYIYYYDIETGKVRRFFPDFIFIKNNGMIGIIEAKGKNIRSNLETQSKFKFIKKYINDCIKQNFNIEVYFWLKDRSDFSRLFEVNSNELKQLIDPKQED